jgi:hypothetical protein
MRRRHAAGAGASSGRSSSPQPAPQSPPITRLTRACQETDDTKRSSIPASLRSSSSPSTPDRGSRRYKRMAMLGLGVGISRVGKPMRTCE